MPRQTIMTVLIPQTTPQTSVGPGPSRNVAHDGQKTMQIFGAVTTGTGSVTVALEGSMDATNWVPLNSVTLPLTNVLATAALNDPNSRYPTYRANVTAISGTGASVSAVLGS